MSEGINFSDDLGRQAHFIKKALYFVLTTTRVVRTLSNQAGMQYILVAMYICQEKISVLKISYVLFSDTDLSHFRQISDKNFGHFVEKYLK